MDSRLIAPEIRTRSQRTWQQPSSILVVDDDPEFLDLLTSEIGRIDGVRIDVASNPDEAYQLLTENSYQLIVSDWALDDSTGPDVLACADRRLGDEHDAERVPVLFISGSEKVDQTRALRALRHFEPVSFILKRCGPPLISLLAESILSRFAPNRMGLNSC